jgi:hypothetical protein
MRWNNDEEKPGRKIVLKEDRKPGTGALRPFRVFGHDPLYFTIFIPGFSSSLFL